MAASEACVRFEMENPQFSSSPPFYLAIVAKAGLGDPFVTKGPIDLMEQVEVERHQETAEQWSSQTIAREARARSWVRLRMKTE